MWRKEKKQTPKGKRKMAENEFYVNEKKYCRKRKTGYILITCLEGRQREGKSKTEGKEKQQKQAKIGTKETMNDVVLDFVLL